MKRPLWIALAVLVAVPAFAGERQFQFQLRSWEAITSGGLPTGEPCTRWQQDQCTAACMAEKEPNELLKKTECVQTQYWGTPDVWREGMFSCGCTVIVLEPDSIGNPEPPPPPNPEA